MVYEMIRWTKKLENYVLEITKLEEKLAYYCGILLSYYRSNLQSNDAINNLLKHQVPTINQHPNKNWNNNELEEWKQKIIPQIQKIVDDIFYDLFDSIFQHKIFKV